MTYEKQMLSAGCPGFHCVWHQKTKKVKKTRGEILDPQDLVVDASLPALSHWPNIKHVLYLQFKIVDAPTQLGAAK